ncbi:MAG: ABC transporter ATP-binding protein [Hyphomicrobiaceae bacterium]
MTNGKNADVLLRIQGLCKGFGGVTATDNLSLDVLAGEVHAIIGPNGAGKTTLISQLSGLLQPDLGTIAFKGQDITALPAHRRAHVGLARSFQITSVFMDMSVLDNVALAVQARDGHSFKFWAPARRLQHLREPALAKLTTVGLAERAHDRAAALSHGERRQLEIAMALGTEPEMLLLDEPMAGMGAEETARMVATLKGLRGTTMLLVEHDMDAVFALADRITVLVYGRVIATGAPNEIRSNADVVRAYLGEAA